MQHPGPAGAVTVPPAPSARPPPGSFGRLIRLRPESRLVTGSIRLRFWAPCHCPAGSAVGISALACGDGQLSSINAVQGNRGEGSQVAAVTRSPGEMVVEDVSGPGRARAGHVIVRPERVGICGSDFHLFSGDVGALSGARDFYPRIQGHEVSAIVEDPGDSERARGERVAIWPLLPCGRCYPCRIGRPNVCPAFRLVGVHLDGGLAERLEVPAGLAFEAGDLDPDSGVLRRARLGGRARPGPRPAAGGRAGGGVRRLPLSAWPRWSRPPTAARGCCRSTRWPSPRPGQAPRRRRSWPGDRKRSSRSSPSGQAARDRRSSSRPAASPAS